MVDVLPVLNPLAFPLQKLIPDVLRLFRRFPAAPAHFHHLLSLGLEAVIDASWGKEYFLLIRSMRGVVWVRSGGEPWGQNGSTLLKMGFLFLFFSSDQKPPFILSLT